MKINIRTQQRYYATAETSLIAEYDLKFKHLEKQYNEGANYSNKEKRLHYPAEAIQ